MKQSIGTAEKVAGLIIAAAIVAIVAVFLVVRVQSPAKYKSAFTNTLDHYLSSRQECLWPDSIQLPARVDIDNSAQMAKFDALVDAGLLNRGLATREHHGMHATKSVEYTLSDMGRMNWTSDPANPNRGDFCFGHMEVNSVNSYQRVNYPGFVAFQVSYRDSVMQPAWAEVPQVEKAFPMLVKKCRGENDFATLVRYGNNWRVKTITSPGRPVV